MSAVSPEIFVPSRLWRNLQASRFLNMFSRNSTVDVAVPDEDLLDEELLPELQAASIRSQVALGERQGHPVRRLGALNFTQLRAARKGWLCADVAGFSLHAAVYCKPGERQKLEMLCTVTFTRPKGAFSRCCPVDIGRPRLPMQGTGLPIHHTACCSRRSSRNAILWQYFRPCSLRHRPIQKKRCLHTSILSCLGLPDKPPGITPASSPEQREFF